MTDYPFTAEDLDTLKAWDTPTICNGLEIVAPDRRAIGFTVEPMVCVDRKLQPIVGLAPTLPAAKFAIGVPATTI